MAEETYSVIPEMTTGNVILLLLISSAKHCWDSDMDGKTQQNSFIRVLIIVFLESKTYFG